MAMHDDKPDSWLKGRARVWRDDLEQEGILLLRAFTAGDWNSVVYYARAVESSAGNLRAVSEVLDRRTRAEMLGKGGA